MPGSLSAARFETVRLSTPDSEAVMSSDDEHELARSTQSIKSSNSQQQQAARRGSVLSEVQQGVLRRRQSLNTSASNQSQPPTPSSDVGGWPAHALGRVQSNPAASAWGASALFTRDATEQQSFPFPIPLYPTPKTYRSQSYSVGQMEEEAAHMGAQSPSNQQARLRAPPQQQAYMHRPSRPSGLSEVLEGPSRDEVDDERVAMGSYHESTSQYNRQYQNGYAGFTKPMQPTAMDVMRHTNRRDLADSFDGLQLDAHNLSLHQASANMRSVEESAVDDDEVSYTFDATGRSRGFLPNLSHQAELNKRAGWSTELGFGELAEAPQSRRHSLADLPTRRNSLSAAAPSSGLAYVQSISTKQFSHFQETNLMPEDRKLKLQIVLPITRV